MSVSLKDYHLSKRTFVNLRWIALLGQLISVLFVEYILKFNFESADEAIIQTVKQFEELGLITK